MKLYDITPTVTADLKVWPGDTSPAREVLLDRARGDSITLSTLRATVHRGAHADAPSHYGHPAPTIEQRPLDLYLGPCCVIRVDVRLGTRVDVADFERGLSTLRLDTANMNSGIPVARSECSNFTSEGSGADSGNSNRLTGTLPPRVLLVTGTFPNPRQWNSNFAALSPTLVDHLHGQGVRLIGIDTPSVDLFDSKDLPAHQRFLAHDMAILEGLSLDGVPAGVYELIALPLKLAGFDASPVRAVLRAID